MKIMYSISRLTILYCVVLSFLVGCGGGGGSSTTDTTTTVDTPVIAGFDFSLSEGDFWEYRWDYDHDGQLEYGRFRVTLGTPVSNTGMDFYPLVITGDPGSFVDDVDGFTPKWQYIAIDGYQILGLNDGDVSYTVIFDAMTGYWEGGGFFDTLNDGTLTPATASTLSNDFIDTSAYMAGVDASQSQCEYIAGVYVCTDTTISLSYYKYDYFKEGIGPVGYFYYNSYYAGTSGSSWIAHVGLVYSSFTHDVTNDTSYTYEIEPNDSPAEAQPLESGMPLVGNAWDHFEGLYLPAMDPGTDQRMDDLYQITIDGATTKSVTISLAFDGTQATNDIDLYLLDAAGNIIDGSLGDNAASGDYTEVINGSLNGTYYIGIDAYNIDSADRVEYTLNWDFNL